MNEVYAVVSTVLIVLLAIAPIPSIGATVYLWNLYRGDEQRPRSWLLEMLAVVGSIVSVAVGYIGFVAMRRLLGFGVLPDVLTVILALTLLMLAGVPVYMAARIYRAAHYGTRPTLPINGMASMDEKRDADRDAARDPDRDTARDLDRDSGRDEGRDLVRDPARDVAHDEEKKSGSV